MLRNLNTNGWNQRGEAVDHRPAGWRATGRCGHALRKYDTAAEMAYVNAIRERMGIAPFRLN